MIKKVISIISIVVIIVSSIGILLLLNKRYFHLKGIDKISSIIKNSENEPNKDKNNKRESLDESIENSRQTNAMNLKEKINTMQKEMLTAGNVGQTYNTKLEQWDKTADLEITVHKVLTGFEAEDLVHTKGEVISDYYNNGVIYEYTPEILLEDSFKGHVKPIDIIAFKVTYTLKNLKLTKETEDDSTVIEDIPISLYTKNGLVMGSYGPSIFKDGITGMLNNYYKKGKDSISVTGWYAMTSISKENHYIGIKLNNSGDKMIYIKLFKE